MKPMMLMLAWLSRHRDIFLGLISLTLWASASLIYIYTDLHRMFRIRRRHAWSVDMQTKQTRGGHVTKHS